MSDQPEHEPFSLCIAVDMPPQLMPIDDECKAIYHSTDSVCVFVLPTSAERDAFIKATAGMDKQARSAYFDRLAETFKLSPA